MPVAREPHGLLSTRKYHFFFFGRAVRPNFAVLDRAEVTSQPRLLRSHCQLGLHLVAERRTPQVSLTFCSAEQNQGDRSIRKTRTTQLLDNARTRSQTHVRQAAATSLHMVPIPGGHGNGIDLLNQNQQTRPQETRHHEQQDEHHYLHRRHTRRGCNHRACCGEIPSHRALHAIADVPRSRRP